MDLFECLPHEKIIAAARTGIAALDAVFNGHIYPVPNEIIRAKVCLEIAIENQQNAIRYACEKRFQSMLNNEDNCHDRAR